MKNRKIYDVTVTIRSPMPTWPGDPAFDRALTHSIAGGDSADVSAIRMGSHTGTHIDAPSHFLAGAPTVDELPIDVLVGEAMVFELGVEAQITRADLEVLNLDRCERILFKTRNSTLWKSDDFTPDFVYIAADAAKYLVDRGVKLVGIDYLSVGEYKSGAQVHRILLEHGVVIVEGLDLSMVKPDVYELMCLPLKIKGADGAPARVVLREL